MSATSSPEIARILQVEDNEADVRLTREALRESGNGVRLSVVGDGEQALAFLRREAGFEDSPRPHLVLLDLNLPRKDGLEVLREMRADPSLARIPVIMLSSSTETRDVDASYAAGASAFVAKPLELDEFIAGMGAIREFWLGVAQLPST
jgi:CheY-like chemotaxis protein